MHFDYIVHILQIQVGFKDIPSMEDGAHIKIMRPTKWENVFVNRKGFHSVNVQVK